MMTCFKNELTPQVPLSGVTKIDLEEKAGSLTLAITSNTGGRVWLRSATGIDTWIAAIKVQVIVKTIFS